MNFCGWTRGCWMSNGWLSFCLGFEPLLFVFPRASLPPASLRVRMLTEVLQGISRSLGDHGSVHKEALRLSVFSACSTEYFPQLSSWIPISAHRRFNLRWWVKASSLFFGGNRTAKAKFSFISFSFWRTLASYREAFNWSSDSSCILKLLCLGRQQEDKNF